MKNNYLAYCLLFILSFLLTTCNKKEEGPCEYPNDKAALLIKVVDNFGVSVDNAVINIFSSFEKFESARLNANNSSFAYDSTRSNAGSEATLLIDSYVDNWILVSIFDPVQQRYLSSELTTSKIDKIQACSDYHIIINLLPVGATVAFWTDSPINLPITVNFNGIDQVLSNATPTAPLSPANPGPSVTLLYTVEPGRYQYQARSENGCTWQGEVTLENGQFTTIKLDACERGVIAFYYNAASSIPTAKQTVTIYLDNNPFPVGVLNGPASIIPSNSCEGIPIALNVVYVYTEPGVTHTYRAESTSGGTTPSPCIWTGTITSLSNICTTNTPIYLGQGCQ